MSDTPAHAASPVQAAPASPRWYRSLYWRIALGLFAFLLLMLTAQSALFTEGPRVAVGPGSGQVVLTDINGDGHVDLVTRHLLQKKIGVFIGDGRGVFTPVKVGIAGEQYFEVLTGLKAGDQVITGPFNSVRELSDGGDVKVQQSNTRNRNRPTSSK